LDRNKRAALIATELLLALNGSDLVVDDAECVFVVLALAAGELEGGNSLRGFAPTSSRAGRKPDQRVSAAFHAATRGSMKRRHSGGSSASSTSEA